MSSKSLEPVVTVGKLDYNHNNQKSLEAMGRKRRRLSTTVAFSAWKATMKRMFHSRQKSKQANKNPLTMHSISLVGNYFQDQFERMSTIEGYSGPAGSVGDDDDEEEDDCAMMYHHTVNSFNSLCDMSVPEPSISSTTTTPPSTPILGGGGDGSGRTPRNILLPNNARFADSCESLVAYSRSNSSDSHDRSTVSSNSGDETEATTMMMSLLPVPSPAYKVRTKISYV